MNKAQKSKIAEYKNILDRPYNNFHPELVDNFAKELLAIDPTPDFELYCVKLYSTSTKVVKTSMFREEADLYLEEILHIKKASNIIEYVKGWRLVFHTIDKKEARYEIEKLC